VQEVCSNAREKAIVQGTMADLVFNAKEATMSVGSAGPPPNPDAPASGGPPASGMSARFTDQVVISALNVNGVDCMQLESARVRFFPNGTCDDMSMVLSRTDGHDSTEIILEPTTGMVWIESDRSKFRTKF
jgi:hypothetical protein